MAWWEPRYWKAYNRIDPFGQDRLDLNFGIVASTVANCHRSKDTDPFTASQFMPKFEKEPEPTEEELEKEGNAFGNFLSSLVGKKPTPRKFTIVSPYEVKANANRPPPPAPEAKV